MIEESLIKPIYQQVMLNDEKSSLVNIQSNTGVSKFFEYLNASVFIRNNVIDFCTVSTTMLAVHRKSKVAVY